MIGTVRYETLSYVNAWLRDVFRAHEVPADVRDEWVVCPHTGHRVNGGIVRETELDGGGFSLRLDVRVELASGQTVIESCAGYGDTWPDAYNEALANFAQNTLHVLLAAFFGVACGEQVNREEWVIGGHPRQVTFSNVGVRGVMPKTADGMSDMNWFWDFQRRLQAQPLPHGTHWVRLFTMRKLDDVYAAEVLLDNEKWGEMEAEIGQMAWPWSEEVYGFRVFLVIQDLDPTRPEPRVLDGCS